MREFVGGLLAFAGMGLFVVAMITLVRPFVSWRIPTRKHALGVLVLSFVVTIIAGTILPQPNNATSTAGAATTTAKAATTIKSEPPKADLTAEVQANWTEILAALEGCDDASKVVATSFNKSRNPYDLYPIVKSAEEVCRTAWSRLNDVDPPRSAKGKSKEAFAKAIDTCETAYLMKTDGYGRMAKVLDGDSRPSSVNAAKESMEAASNGQMLCVASYMSAALEAGVPLESLQKEKSNG